MLLASIQGLHVYYRWDVELVFGAYCRLLGDGKAVVCRFLIDFLIPVVTNTPAII